MRAFNGIFLALTLFSSCLTAAPAVEQVAQDYNAFGFDLLAQTGKSVAGKNVFLSPLSAALALSMVQSGAEGETLKEMTQTLHLQGNSPSEINEANAALTDSLSKIDPTIKLEIANSLWIRNGLPIRQKFIADSKDFYHAEVANVDFGNPATVKTINNWVSEHTKNKIKEIVSAPLESTLRVILLDAIYFKGDWTEPFDKKQTREMPFTLLDKKTVQHPRMNRTGEFGYFENDDFQAVVLPYANREISMYVFLPKAGLDTFLPMLTATNWESWLPQFRFRKGTLGLPRFKLENKYELNEPLANMGMRLAFATRANFSGMSEEPLCIGWVKQKTYVDVNEEGTEAAAVTGIGMEATSVRREPPPFKMTVDHPFFAAIRENKTGAILFMGTIVDPR
jgi:serine protease inhibitor